MIDESLLSRGHVLSCCSESLGIFGRPVEKAKAFDNFLVIETNTPEQLLQIFCHLHSQTPVL